MLRRQYVCSAIACQMYLVKNTNIIYYESSAPADTFRCAFIGEIRIGTLLVESFLYYLILLNNYDDYIFINIYLPTPGKICNLRMRIETITNHTIDNTDLTRS